ncbi:hypothetical protein QBC34DRAFT_415234 [Podospora aff. communis PSN243]|uniref:ferroxidase n=1 Tax=Podospora aff. communis PSN243 TaxID=3040156 RepID=A0AAV9G8V1_9PEZI|nr:hypothetical protein QBC34DRAFT_415234 [Podospora aff. communis PSN243]
MARLGLSKLNRLAHLGLRVPRGASVRAFSLSRPNIGVKPNTNTKLPRVAPTPRFVSSSSSNKQHITPDGEASEPQAAPEVVRTPAVITDAEYHSAADDYMDRLLSHLEALEEQNADMEVEYSAGVMKISFGPESGTYVINKQPPNKQIWLSSPKSGPKRYDYVILGDGQHEKQDTACGEWLYLRDNTTMAELLREEIGIDLRMPVGDYGE